jgi:hypothetical protein
VSTTATTINRHIDVLVGFFGAAARGPTASFDRIGDVRVAAQELTQIYLDINAAMGRLREKHADLQLRHSEACLSLQTDENLKVQCAGMYLCFGYFVPFF